MVMRSLVVLTLLALSACVVRTGPGPGPAPRRNSELHDNRRDAAYDANSPWDKLGQRWINGRVDRDSIHVGRRDGAYRAIKLVVEHSAVELYDVTIVFENGEVYSPNLRYVFGQGTTSRTIDLPGARRLIRRVQFSAGNLPGGGRAQIEVWGLR